jgi:hypothetical protein
MEDRARLRDDETVDNRKELATAMVLDTVQQRDTRATTSNTLSSALRLSAIAICSCVSLACGDGPTEPSRGALVTFRVVDETFRVHLLDEGQIDAARRAANGGPARIPIGRVVTGAGVNTGWSWHLEDVEFAELTTEVCDGRPSDVEREGVTFGGGRFCPWTARVTSIQED